MTSQFDEYTELQLGDIVGDTNRMVIAMTKKNDRIPGNYYATWLAICVKEDEIHPYVVWNIIARPKGFVADQGNYASTLQQAIDYYYKRGGKP